LSAADQAKGTSGIGALLRREGLYFSLLSSWRRETLRLTEELRKAEIVIDIQKTVATLLGRPILTVDPAGKP